MAGDIGKKALFVKLTPNDCQPIRRPAQATAVFRPVDIFQLCLRVLVQPSIQLWLQLLQWRRVFRVKPKITLHRMGVHPDQQPVNRFKNQRRVVQVNQFHQPKPGGMRFPLGCS